MRSLLRRFETFNKWCATGGGIILMIAAIVTTYDVFCRFLFNNPTIWALETAQYCLIYGTFLGGGICFQKRFIHKS
jgi:TRAP-type C4-dicarboxylate transport system permease small subunit